MKLAGLDPRIKLFLLVGISAAALFFSRPAALLALLCLTAFVLLSGGVGPVVIWKKLRGLFALIVSLFIVQCLFNRSGEPALVLAGVVIVTDAGLDGAVLVNLRLLIIVLSALIVLSGELRDYLLALTAIRVPYEIVFMVLVAFRFLPVLREEAQDVFAAAQMRGLQIKKTGLKKKAGAYVSIVLPVLAGAIRRTEQMSIAMEARGFRAFPRRTNMRSLRLRAADLVYAAVFCAVMAVIIVVL